MNVIVVIVVTVGFTAFDLWGYPLHHAGRWAWFRFAQTALQWFLYACAWHFFGWQPAVASFIVWWSGGCDILYYQFGALIGRPYDLFSETAWYWLAWTPVGIPRFVNEFIVCASAGNTFMVSWRQARLRVRIATATVIAQASCGSGVAFVLCWL